VISGRLIRDDWVMSVGENRYVARINSQYAAPTAPCDFLPPLMDLTLRETGTAATEARRTERETNTAESCMIGGRGFGKWIRTRNEDVDRAQLWMKFVKGMRGERAKARKRWRLLSDAGQALYDAFGVESPGTTSRTADCDHMR
jgi:hypothetical protein